MADTYAGDIITVVRDLIPDPVYAASTSGGVAVGDPLPNVDGNLFRSQSLRRWVDEAVKQVAKEAGYIINDFIPIAVTSNQPYYTVDGKWISIFDAWFKELKLTFLDTSEQLGPYQLRGDTVSSWGYWRRADKVQVSLMPIPATGDQVTKIRLIAATGDTIVSVTNCASFNSYGWAQIDSSQGSEIVAYQTVSGNAVDTDNMLYQVSRGQCGTASMSHASGDTITHLGLVLNGVRMPVDITTVTGSTGLVELPSAFIYAIQLYVLWKVRTAENDEESAMMQYKLWNQEMEKIKANPYWRQKQGMQIAPYGGGYFNRLFGGLIVTR